MKKLEYPIECHCGEELDTSYDTCPKCGCSPYIPEGEEHCKYQTIE